MLKSLKLSPLAACLLGLSLSFVGCADLDNFDAEVSSEITLQGATALDLLLGQFPVGSELQKFDITQTTAFKNSKYSPDDVDSIFLTKWRLTVLSPAEQDLAFLGAVTFYIETQGQPRIVLAQMSEFPAGEGVVDFELTSADLKNYVLAREAEITTEIKDSNRPPQETRVRLDAVFDVDVRIF